MNITDALNLVRKINCSPIASDSEAFEFCRYLEKWESGDQSREVGLQLMFLSWYLMAEPPCNTGLSDDLIPSLDFSQVFHEVHKKFQPTVNNDPEMLYVVGLMASLFPYLLGEESEIERLGVGYQVKYRKLAPKGIPECVFTNRGAYGKYFEHQIKGGRC